MVSASIMIDFYHPTRIMPSELGFFPALSGLMNIIIVEDTPFQQKFLQKMLSHRDDITQLLTAGDGKEGFNIIKQHLDLDLIITDHNMPLVSGLELIRQLKADQEVKHIPVIIMSAEVPKEHMLEAIESGAEMEILKPFTAKDLNKSIDYILRKGDSLSFIELTGKIKEMESELNRLKQQLVEKKKAHGNNNLNV